MGLNATEGSSFPKVEVEFGLPHGDKEPTPVTITLSEFAAIITENADSALKKGTPIPPDAQAILTRAADGCRECHLLSREMKSVGQGFGARCDGFTQLEGDLYSVMVNTDGGRVTAAMEIVMPPDGRFSKNFPTLTTPCGVTPAFFEMVTQSE